MLYERLTLIRELLSDSGSIYVHVDWHVSHYVKGILDQVFGADNFQNEIIWQRTSARSDSVTYNHIHDTIFFCTKGESFIWNAQFEDHSDEYVAQKYTHTDSDGRRYRLDNMTSPNPRPNMMYEWKGFPFPEKGWRYSKETMQKLHDEGRIWYPNDKSKRPQYKRYLDELSGRPLQSVWTDIYPVNSQANERLDYPTQKSEALLDRIIQASSNEGDLVADFFCGSGTTGAVAERLGRRWLMCDLERFVIHTSRKRMIELQRKLHSEGKPYRAFDVYNLGRYERQWWQKDRLQGADEEHRRVILEFFKAEVLTNTPSPLLHGRKAGAFCHVDGIDSMFTREEAKQVAQATAQAGGSAITSPGSLRWTCICWYSGSCLSKPQFDRVSESHKIRKKLLMPAPLSIDLRQRIIAAYEAKEGS
jgi:adenine specific DNA methylase Mod